MLTLVRYTCNQYQQNYKNEYWRKDKYTKYILYIRYSVKPLTMIKYLNGKEVK